MNRRQTLVGASAAGLIAATNQAGAETAQPALKPFPVRRSVNLGNGLDAPSEGEWGYRIEDSHLDLIAAAHFDGIRLPVRWDTHMAADAPYRIDPTYMARVDHVVAYALGKGLKVQLDVHHFVPMNEHPDQNMPRFRACWRQIAEHFSGAPDALLFEPLNEPNGAPWTGGSVRDMDQAMLEEIRPSNPTRTVVMGGPQWNSIDGLAHWTPPDDPHIVVTAHYYEPFNFTHQDAAFLGANAPHFGREWGTPADIDQMHQDLGRAAAWGREHGYAMQIGEFGVNERVPLAQRARWTYCMRYLCESLGMGWSVWGFTAGFPIFDPATGRFIPAMLQALMAPAAQ
ncbi:MAG: glycoside hydrolase family 5 protein [Pseudomonadota bacterium]